MPPILNAQSVSKAFGAAPLFRNISLTVSEGNRTGLIGPNGAGKSTLLSVLAGTQQPDSGEVAVRKRARVACVAQDSLYPAGLTVRDILERALLAAHIAKEEREGRLRELAGRAGFAAIDADAASLSRGWRKRLAIAEALVVSPDVLLLDEPTNHLDLAGIRWLEELLEEAEFAAVIVSHDRYFLENVANEIVELNRIYADGLLRVRGKFSRFLEERQAYLESQSREQESLRNRVRTEIEWLRRGPKARTTKSKARIGSAHEMIRKLADMDSRSVVNNAGIDFHASDRKTRRLITLEDVSFKVGERTLFEKLSFVFTAGTRVGLVGANDSGKTTLLRLLRGEQEPSSGTIQRADFLKIVYFSQLREIDPTLTLRRALAPDGDTVVYQGRQIHVASWAARFLFTGEQLNQPVERLSGGERARVLIARLMLDPADLLLLDEPTNDLDIPTLEILEDSLLEFPGALVLVTHDRYLLDRVSTTVLGLNGKGGAAQFAGYAQWEDWQAEVEAPKAKAAAKTEPASAPKQETKKKLSYLEAREFAAIEQRVEEADARLDIAKARAEDPAVATNAAALEEALAEMEAARQAVDALYARWADLTEKAG